MRIFKLIILLAIFFGLILPYNLFSMGDKEIQKTYEGKKRIKLKLVLGSCYIKKSQDKDIHINLEYSYDDENFEPRFKEKENSIYVQEKFFGRDSRGDSRWTISVPKNIEIDFESATGSLYIERVNVEIKGNTGTGDIEIQDAKGDFDLNTGTGSIEVTKSQGEFDLSSGTGRVTIENSNGNYEASSGTGDVEAYNLTIEDEADFSSGTGDAEVTLPQGDDFDLSISSGTNDAILNLDGKTLEGYFEFTAHGRKGRIISPVEFDEEKEYWNGDGKYIRKSFTKGKKTPRFYIKTGTGKAKLSL